MDSFTLPLKLTCSVSGKVVTYTSAEYVKKKLEKFGGSLERLHKEFVCRDAKVPVAKPVAVDIESYDPKTPGLQITVGAEALSKPATPIQYDWKIGKPVPMTQADAPKDVCFNPPWMSKHGGACDGCAMQSVCNYTKKRFLQKQVA